MFTHRADAGRRLASALRQRGVGADVVLAIPRGGLPVARPVADALEARLDVVVAEKLGAPDNPELAVGAVAGDGSVWLNDELVERLGIEQSYLDTTRDREAANAREKVSLYRDGDAAPDVEGRRVVVVDDGIATGATAIACLRQVQAADAARVVLAVPVAPPDALDALRNAVDVDALVCLETPAAFGAVGSHYRQFDQVTNGEALAYLSE
jgi:predicted phosphoribosyltransferase